MTAVYITLAIITMALVTYIPRVLPLVAVRRKIKSPFLNSFLYYMPYAVLAGMTFPAILYSTSSTLSAALHWRRHCCCPISGAGWSALHWRQLW